MLVRANRSCKGRPGTTGGGILRVGNHDYFRLGGGNQGVAQRLAFVRQPGNDDVRPQIVGLGEQLALAGAAEIGEQEDARAVEIAAQHQRRRRRRPPQAWAEEKAPSSSRSCRRGGISVCPARLASISGRTLFSKAATAVR